MKDLLHPASNAARRSAAWLLVAAATAIAACGEYPTPSKVAAPGADKRAGTAVLEAGAAVLQDKPPVDTLNAYLDGFHFYGGRMEAQMEAHHYCSILNEEVIQCVIFDGNMKAAKLMGEEYILSEQLFHTLPEGEKALWHSHVHEVKSGQLIAPGIPEAAEHALMKKLVNTYGKTFHTWHTGVVPIVHRGSSHRIAILLHAHGRNGSLRRELRRRDRGAAPVQAGDAACRPGLGRRSAADREHRHGSTPGYSRPSCSDAPWDLWPAQQ